MKRLLMGFLIASCLIGISRSAWALASGAVSASSVSCGTYDTLAVSPLPGTGNVNVSCSLIGDIAHLVAY